MTTWTPPFSRQQHQAGDGSWVVFDANNVRVSDALTPEQAEELCARMNAATPRPAEDWMREAGEAIERYIVAAYNDGAAMPDPSSIAAIIATRAASAQQAIGFAIPDRRRATTKVAILCAEIKHPWSSDIETSDVFCAFIRELSSELRHHIEINHVVAKHLGQPSQSKAPILLDRFDVALSPGHTDAQRIAMAAAIHDDPINRDNPELNCDHDIDMISSLASAIRFGLETPCRSRHAAAAGEHICRRIYGFTRHDNFTADFQDRWLSAKLDAALQVLGIEPGKEGQR